MPLLHHLYIPSAKVPKITVMRVYFKYFVITTILVANKLLPLQMHVVIINNSENMINEIKTRKVTSKDVINSIYHI